MKVLAISGGSKNGSNDAMAKEALMGAKEQGADVEFIHLLDLDLRPCTGCIACVGGLMSGGSGNCIIRDDLAWLDDKMMEADAIIFVMPIFEKGAPAVLKIIQDRMFGPAHDKAMNMVATEIAKQSGKKGPDPRKLEDKAVSFISIGGSDWSTRISCDMNLLAMSRMWTVIDDVVFSWAKSIVIQDENVTLCHQVGERIAKAASNINEAKYQGDPGICPNCHSRNFMIGDDPAAAICEVCGMIGTLKAVEGKMVFEVPEEQWEHAHNLIPGKMKHIDDIHRNEGQLLEDKKTPEFKSRMETYKAFIEASKPVPAQN